MIRPRSAKRAFVLALCALTLPLVAATSACTSAVDIKETFEVTDLAGGWFDAGVENGKNKLVPTVTFRVRKKVDRAVRPLSLNVHFKRLVQGNEEDWEEAFLQRVEIEGNQTDLLTIKPKVGYTADPPQSRADMLAHSQFVDVRIVIFAKQSSSNWVELARYDLPRQLLTQ